MADDTKKKKSLAEELKEEKERADGTALDRQEKTRLITAGMEALKSNVRGWISDLTEYIDYREEPAQGVNAYGDPFPGGQLIFTFKAGGRKVTFQPPTNPAAVLGSVGHLHVRGDRIDRTIALQPDGLWIVIPEDKRGGKRIPLDKESFEDLLREPKR